MSDNNEELKLPASPAWLQQTQPPTSGEVAEHIAAETETPPQFGGAINPAAAWTLGDMPTGPAPGPMPEAGDPVPELAPEPEADPQVTELTRWLLQFKRFWATPAGTHNEVEAAAAFASIVVEFLKKKPQPQPQPEPEETENAAKPQRSRTRREPS